MTEQVATGSSLHSNPVPSAPNLNTKEEVAEEIKKWMERTENDQEGKEKPKSCDNAVSYIETQLNRPLSTWKTTWIERQYVITLLKLWLKKSLGKAFEYLEDEENDISEEMSTLLGELDSINSFDDIRFKLNDVTSPLRNLRDGGCRYLQLILDQTDLIRNTPRYTFFVTCYLKQFKTSCIDKVFSRCIGDIVKDENNGKKHETLIIKLNDFLAFVNEDKNLIKSIFKEKFHKIFAKDDGQNWIEKLVKMFVACSMTKFLTNIEKSEKLKLILEKDMEENNVDIENVTEIDWQGIFHRQVSKISQSFIEADGNQAAQSSIPDWFARLEIVSSLLNDVEWTPKLQILTKEICKKFILPETEIKFLEEDGKKIISIKGFVIFVSQMIEEMKDMKEKHPEVEEIKIVGLNSVHIDCNLDNDNWNRTNIGIVTEKLIVGDVRNKESHGFCWNLSGQNAIIDLTRGERHQPGESGGNVHIICNEIINGKNWTIVSDGGDGSDGFKWTREKFENSFPFMSTDDKGEAMKTVLATLKDILPREKRWRGEDIMPRVCHEINLNESHNFLIQGESDNGNYITATFFKDRKEKQTLIHIRGGWVGQGGYGGDIAIECLATSEINGTSMTPLTGKDSRPLTAVRLGVYERSGRNGKIGKMSGDVGFLQKGANCIPEFFGFENDEKIEIELDVKEEELQKEDLYVKYEKRKKEIRCAKLKRPNSEFHSEIIESAVKKKSVIRQSLVLHLDEIDERNRLTKSIQNMLSNPTEHKSNTINEILSEMGENVHQLYHLTVQRQQHQRVEQEQYVRPAIDSSRPIPMPKLTGRRPVLIDDRMKKDYLRNVKVYCLDELSTEDGIDNLLHCLFGQINSQGKFVCKDTTNFRKGIANYIREQYYGGGIDDDTYGYNAVVMFVLRVNDDQNFPVAIEKRKKLIDSFIEDNRPLKGMETQVLRWLNHNDDYDDGEFLEPNEVKKWNEAWQNIGEPNEIKTELLQEKEVELGKEEDLIEEYAKYIESPTGTLGLAELKILEMLYLMYVHIFKKRGSLYYQPKKTGKQSDYFRCFILYGNGKWKRLSPNNNLNYFCKLEVIQKCDEPIGNTDFENLKSWIDRNEEIADREKVLTCIEKFNPKDKTPDKLSRLVLQRIKEHNMDAGQIKLMDAICLLSEWVDYYNTRSFSPIFYLTIVEKWKAEEWNSEFLLLEIQKRLDKSLENEKKRDKWRKLMRNDLNSPNQELSLFMAKIAMKRKEEMDILFSSDSNKLLLMLIVLQDISSRTNDILDNIGHSLLNFYYKHRNQFWEKKLDEWLKKDDQLETGKKGEYVNFLLEYKNYEELIKLNLSNKPEVLRNILLKLQNSTSESRGMKGIIDEMKAINILQNDQIEEGKIVKIIEGTDEISFDKLKETRDKIIAYGLPSDLNDSSLKTFLRVFNCAVYQTMGFQLRDTQKVTIIILLKNKIKSNTLAQVSTGEGKSIIVAGVAIGFALFKKEKRNSHIDVITSNDVLAIRDSSLSVALSDGGLKELYDFFNVTVANNCSKFIHDRQKAYNMDVVYGTLANFQRDHLLDKFYDYNIRGERKMDNVIIDEVDCMLLDRGNNILYLSHDIPGMEMLESLYLFIWANIKEKNEWIKSAILFDLYGQINEEQLNLIHDPLRQEFKGERTAIWEHLIEKKIFDRQGRLVANEVKEITEEKIKYTPINEALNEKQLNPKIVFYLHSIVQRERRIRIPSHLLPFVDRHLDTWLDNARRALKLKQDEDYVIDHVRSDTSPDLSPRVIIIDPDTGTDQSSSQWDDGLHQFLQLKEGCKLTLQTLKAVFISNYTYITKYKKLAGVSGTLGSKLEQEYLKDKYRCDSFTIPTAFLKRFSLKPPKLFKTEQCWRDALTKETRRTIIEEKRSIIVFCRSIKEVNKIYQQLKSAISDQRGSENKIHRYTRDYERFPFENASGLDEGHVIVATNLAGRGTNINISKKLEANGGLHICLTYFPENERVEDQAMGRAARKGEPGSGILILCESPNEQKESGTIEEWGVEKIFVMKEERAWKERQRISRLGKDFENINMLEKLFDSFTKDFRNLKKNIETKKKEKSRKSDVVKLLDVDVLLKVIQGSALDKWALLLDETDYNLKWFNISSIVDFKIDFGDFDLTSEFFTSSTPARRIETAKHLATIKIKETNIFKKYLPNLKGNQEINAKETANLILNKLIDSTEKFLYPAAFYYRAFILLTELKRENKNFEEEKKKLIRLLRRTEIILIEHIDMQMSFIQIHQSINRKLNQTASFCAVDVYEEQKKNNIEILQYFIGSIEWMLGSRCSISDLREAAASKENKKPKTNEELKTEKVDDYFNKLIKFKCIDCKLNDPNTIPSECDGSPISDLSSVHQTLDKDNRYRIIKKIAHKYGVISSASLENKLKIVFDKTLNEDEIEQELKNTNLIPPCSRKMFWEKLVQAKALNLTKELKTTECVLISEAQLKDLPKLEIKKAITLEFGIKSLSSNNRLYVLYHPTYNSQQELRDANKFMFCKEYVKNQLLPDEYHKRKEDFESNKIAQLDLDQLKLVNLESFGRLCLDDLSDKNIDHSERKEIWNQLVQQKIINDDRGYLAPNFDITKDFSYPECPAYADVVMRLVGKKFVAEIVRQQWLKVKENPNWFKAINLLPRKPYRDMLADLMAANVISGARVTEDFAINLKEEVDKIAENKQESKCLMEFLTSRQSVYAEKPKAHEFFLDFMERDLKFKFSGELHVFRLAGFDYVIDIKDREWTSKRICLVSLIAPLIITGGLASIGLGAALYLIPKTALENALTSRITEILFGVTKNLFLMGGFSDIMYVVDTILSRKDFTWADYGRQRIRSAMGKTEPINAIKATKKLSNSSNKSFVKDVAKTNVHLSMKSEDQNHESTDTGIELSKYFVG